MKKLIYLVVLLMMVSCNALIEKVDNGVTPTGKSDIDLRIAEHQSNSVTLEWDYKGVNPYCFRILKGFDELEVDPRNQQTPPPLRKWAVIAKLGSEARSFVDEKVKPGENPNYIIRSCRDEQVGHYSNEVLAGSASGVNPPKLQAPIQVGESIQLIWSSLPASLGQITSFRIIRKTSLDGAQTTVGTVAAVLNQALYRFLDTPPSSGYYIYQIEAVSSSGNVLSESKGTTLGTVVPGVITSFKAFMLSTSESKPSSGESSPRDVILEWSYSGNACIFIINLRVGATSIDSIKQVLSTDPGARADGSGGGFMVRIPYVVFKQYMGSTITFEIYPKTTSNGALVSSSINTSSSPSISAASTTLSASGSGQSLSLTLRVNLPSDGFVSGYNVQRKDCGETFTSCDACGSSVKVYPSGSMAKYISGRSPLSLTFREYFGSSRTSLQRVDGHNYCYSFTLSNGYGTSSTPWELH